MTTKVKADPTKAFFVRMLTRDITLDDCILDLIDNSVDGAWAHSGQNPGLIEQSESLSSYRVDIVCEADHFSIKDNCGGISLNSASEYAFTFGRDPEAPNSDGYSVGVYGIGMKRAVFKIGNNIEIRSTFIEDGEWDSFVVPINVSDWMTKNMPPWDFDLEQADPAPEAGVEISITNLSRETTSRFENPTYAKSLRRILARDYMIPLMRGLKITVNGEPVHGWQLELRGSEDFAPMRDNYDDNGVHVEIIAGMVSPPPSDSGPDEQHSKHPETSGWYVICNGRAVLAADTSRVTGWGEGNVPKWHRQYTGFAGLALFSSTDSISLPMTTTKRSVDEGSPIFRRALHRMATPTKAWTSYTNLRKNATDEAEPKEKEARPIPLAIVTPRPEIQLPKLKRSASRQEVANVNYAVTVKKLRSLAEAFGDITMTYRDVGVTAFDFAYDELVSDD